MKTKSILLSILSLSILLVLSGCGKKVELPVGNDISDASYLSDGRFHEVLIDTSVIPGDFYKSAGVCNDSGYSYILSSYDYSSAANVDYLVSLDKNGNVGIFNNVDKPITVNNGSLSFSSVCGDLGLLDHISNDYDCFVNYSEYSFDVSGAFSSVCNVYITYALENGMGDTISEYYRVNWDNTGKCISVSPVEDDYSASYSLYDSEIKDLNNNFYRLTTSGIIHTDDNNQYLSGYFSFINSGIFSYGFDHVQIINSDSFSGIYRNAENKTVLSCFIRDVSVSDQKAIVIASSDLDFDLMSDVLAFNSENDKVDITVIDYSDKSLEKDPLEGWSLLKEDVLGGFKPDIILNTTGNDEIFTSKLVSLGLPVDLKNIVSKDSDLSDSKFTDKASSLFYSGDSIYSIVPSYTYRTVVGDSGRLSDVKWDINTFMDYADSTDVNSMFFMLDHKDAFLKRVVEFNGFSYVDAKSGSASFDSDEFITFLKYASRLPEDISEANNLYYWGIEPCDVLLKDQICNGIGNMHYEAIVSLRNNYVDLGFPIGTELGSGVISADNSFMIISGRAYTNECWSFIKKYLTPEYQNQLTLGIPVTQSGFDQWTTVRFGDYRYFSADSYYRDGVEYIAEMVTDEEADMIVKNINDCRRMEFMDYRIEQIVLEYAHQYFDGKLSVEEAAAAIDRDVEAYLAS